MYSLKNLPSEWVPAGVPMHSPLLLDLGTLTILNLYITLLTPAELLEVKYISGTGSFFIRFYTLPIYHLFQILLGLYFRIMVQCIHRLNSGLTLSYLSLVCQVS